MPGYILLQSFATISTASDLKFSLDMYQEFLDKLGYVDKDTNQWLSSFTWKSLIDDGFASMHTWRSVEVNEKAYHVAPSIVGFAQDPDKGANVSWIELSLMFEAHAITYSPHDWRYRPDTGRGIWEIMRLFFTRFTRSGVYLTDEVNDSQTWYALSGLDGKLWSFDLALVPRSFARHFSEMPSEYKNVNFEEGIAFIRTNAWITDPWDDPSHRQND